LSAASKRISTVPFDLGRGRWPIEHTFDYSAVMDTQLRWTTTEEPGPQSTLFDPNTGMERHVGKGEYRGVESRTLINRIPASAPLPFEHTINAYRGCSHACSYCFARPTHEYLGFGMGSDFDSKIVVKVNAIDLTRAETAPRRWAGQPIAMGTNTDPYQRAEGKYKLTRGIVEVLGERRNPFSILTKSSLVLRDLDLLSEVATRTRVTVDFSIATLDDDVWRISEPGTPHPRRRIEAVKRLNEAGVPSGILMAPVLPGLSDRTDQLEEVVVAGLDAGARFISPMYLHLRGGLREHYLDWLAGQRPDLARRIRAEYGPAGYAPQADAARLSNTVRDLIERHGGIRTQRMARADMARTITAPDVEQMGFELR
jgi:DNA repair photolyase